MADQETRIIEIGGVKLEVDLRHVKTVEKYRIGDNVKVLQKEYSDTYHSYPGVIVGFDNFVARPTIIIAYLDGSAVNFLFLNADSKDAEICPMVGDDLTIDKQGALDVLDRDIARREGELVEAKAKRMYFIANFGRYFQTGEE